MSDLLNAAPLGKSSVTPSAYDPGLLFPIPRSMARDELLLQSGRLPFMGNDAWTAYELGWLNMKGKPQVGIGYISVPCESPNMIESKSFKLYLNSFNNERISDAEQLAALIERDINAVLWAHQSPLSKATCRIVTPDRFTQCQFGQLEGLSLDRLDIDLDHVVFHELKVDTEQPVVTEVLNSNLIRALCRVTGQPDWGSVQIEYTGQPIIQESLLRYLISFRNKQEFHEPLAERIFMDIMRECRPLKLSVQLRFTRRGGMDINPLRTSYPRAPVGWSRLARQ